MKQLITFLLVAIVTNTHAQEYLTKKDIQYYADTSIAKDAYIASQCRLDLYYPANKKILQPLYGFTAVV
jgi:hypothetical protein